MAKKKDTILIELHETGELLKPVNIIAPVVKDITDRFTDNGNGTIFDKVFKVLWIKDPLKVSGLESTMNFPDTKLACDKLTYAGYNSGWRMPTVEELKSIVDYTRHGPAWNPDVFDGKYNNWYWTSTPCSWDKLGAAWCVYFGSGIVDGSYMGSSNYIRPVRSS